jgi:threonine/homoserine/homoserine lactone efflux protein
MSIDLFLAMMVFAFVASITPGPNNFLLLASGVNFGFRRTLPHMAGSCLGFLWLLLAVGFGLGTLLTLYPPFHLALKIAGGGWLLYLAWKIGMSRSLSDGSPVEAQPMTFFEATMFTWINPKAWVSGLASMAIYTDPAQPYVSVAMITGAFMLAGFPCVPIWVLFGVGLRTFLSDPVRLKWFNIIMGLALAATLWPMLR